MTPGIAARMPTKRERLLMDASGDGLVTCAAMVYVWGADLAAPGPPATEVQPPDDMDLKRTIDAMAPFVARNGAAFEAIAVRQNARDNRFSFLKGGPGAEYYRWRVQAGYRACLSQSLVTGHSDTSVEG